MTAEVEFSFPIDITSLPLVGRSYTIKASAEECARVATRLDLQAVNSLTAVLNITPGGKGIIKVGGEVRGDVVQTCVVSLGPVPALVKDAVSANFITEEKAAADKLKMERAKAKARATKKATEEEEELISAQGDDPPDVALAGRIDLGEVAVTHLALALNPYPRAPGAAFDPKAWGLHEENPEKPANVSAFAALAKLKKPGS